MAARFSEPLQTGLRAHATSYTMYAQFFAEAKRLGRANNHLPHPTLRLKKEYGYISIPSLRLRGRLSGELYLLV
jgi:hypothetical protein